jgi:hypothetical protein
MNELLNNYLPPFITEYVYLPYLLIVWLIVEWIRYQFDGIDNRIKPKHLTAIVGVFTGLSTWLLEKYGEGVTIPITKLLISYFVTTILYEYLIKPVKEKLFPKFSDKQKV